MATIDDIERDLLDRAKGASVDELSKITDAIKAVSETKYTELNAGNKARETRLELIKSMAALLVPLVSLLALCGTIIIQNEQIGASRQQQEDTEWRDLLTSLKGTSDSVYSDPTVAPRLRSFFGSRTYGDQAKAIAGRLMGHISNPDGFTDLFAAVFGEVDAANVGSVLDIGRELTTSRQALTLQCNDLLKNADIPYDPALGECGTDAEESLVSQAIQKFKVPAQFGSLHQSSRQLARESWILESKILPFLRANYHVPRDFRRSPGLNLSGQSFLMADFTQLDLTGFKVAGTVFDTVDFTGAIIAPDDWTRGGPQAVDQPDFRGSIWWEAQSVEPTLLGFLILRYYPYASPTARYPVGYKITQPSYAAKVSTLCKASEIPCPSLLKFGTTTLK
jgi:hypothetical protein